MRVARFLHAYVADMQRIRVQILQLCDQSVGEILVVEKSHAEETDISRRSRSAANAKQARMSSCVRLRVPAAKTSALLLLFVRVLYVSQAGDKRGVLGRSQSFL